MRLFIEDISMPLIPLESIVMNSWGVSSVEEISSVHREESAPFSISYTRGHPKPEAKEKVRLAILSSVPANFNIPSIYF
jgi:hypothetical protein